MVLLQGLCYVVDITMVFLTFIGIFDFDSVRYLHYNDTNLPKIMLRCNVLVNWEYLVDSLSGIMLVIIALSSLNVNVVALFIACRQL